MLVGEDLGLDVAGIVQVALDEAFATAEGGNGLSNGRVEEFRNLVEGAGDLEAPAAAPKAALIAMGRPWVLANSTISSASATGSGVPSTCGRPLVGRYAAQRPCRRAT